MSRKRRSNRLSLEQLQVARDERQAKLHQLTILIGFGQDHLPWWESLYRSVSLEIAIRMVRDGEAEQFEAATDNGSIVLFRELKPFQGVQYALPTLPNAAAAQAIAAYSPNARLSGRDLRRVENVIAFPFVGDTKAARVAPRVTLGDIGRAQQLCRRIDGYRPATAGHCTRVLRQDLAVAA